VEFWVPTKQERPFALHDCIASSEEPFLQFGLVYSPFDEVSAGTVCSAR
jgi:hypothetical protein